MTAPAAPFLPYGRQAVDDDDIAAVVKVLKGAWLTGGPSVATFEEAFAKIANARHAVACSNGTTALHLAALAADLGPGSVAIVPTLTFLATANCIRYVGGEVAFADVDPDSGLLTPETLDAALVRIKREGGKAPSAVLPVHLAGQTCDMAGIAEIARRHNLTIIEDACHAAGTIGTGPGAENDPAGSCKFGDMAVFSFHPVKTMTTGEGGLITTNDDRMSQRMRLFRNHGMIREADGFSIKDQAFGPDGKANPWYYEMAELGFNFRLDDIACALGLSQLAKLPRFAERRRALADYYDELLAPMAPLVRSIPNVPWCKPAWHLYVALIDFKGVKTHRAEVMRRLQERGIGTQVHYLPVHRQPYYRDRIGTLELPDADAYYERCLSLPLFPDMQMSDVERVVTGLQEVLS